MKARKSIAFLLSLLVVIIAFSACGKTTTLIVPAKTVTLPGFTTTLPAVTVTLPGKVTTIPATTIIIPSSTTVLPETTLVPPTVDLASGLLPSTPIVIGAHMASLITKAGPNGDCVGCHGPNAPYYQFPLPPEWDGAHNGSLVHTEVYNVVPGSIQDHTGRTNDMCLTCHSVSK